MAQRILMNARVTGFVQRDAPKLKKFMISVFWSDESEVIIYRSFQEFRKFHRQLKKRFPLFNPLRRKDRLIPKFSGEARKTNLQQRGSKRSIQRMRFLENYCTQLLKCDPSVTKSSEVSQFFTPKAHDLQPDFTKNSVLVMLSDDLPDVNGGGEKGHQSIGNVSHPFVTQTYRCIALYETKDTKNRAFKVAADEKLDVLIKDPAGWWLVENEEKRVAWFPAPYLELLDEEEGEDVACPSGGSLYIALRNYSTQKADEVPVNIGSVVELLQKSDNGWWLIRFNGKVGYIPSMYLQPYNNPRAGLFSLQTKLNSSTLNLASRGPQLPLSPQSPSIREEEEEGFEPSGRLHKARSLDMLSGSWSQRPQVAPDTRRSSNISQESNLSGLSSGSGSEASSENEDLSKDPAPQPIPQSAPHQHRDSSSGSSTFSSESSSQAPRVPMRPKTNEILSRCTTMTRKAALASQARLQVQPTALHAR
ncbi:NADPH oxidase organizer 1b [Eucyclogobius newberryi]|uniref:NADPH oxidase organizer 1b n=1 Tax=Eucyclogobius newberryi TaxID=166745 RepID=UPI003B597A04